MVLVCVLSKEALLFSFKFNNKTGTNWFVYVPLLLLSIYHAPLLMKLDPLAFLTFWFTNFPHSFRIIPLIAQNIQIWNKSINPSIILWLYHLRNPINHSLKHLKFLMHFTYGREGAPNKNIGFKSHRLKNLKRFPQKPGLPKHVNHATIMLNCGLQPIFFNHSKISLAFLNQPCLCTGTKNSGECQFIWSNTNLFHHLKHKQCFFAIVVLCRPTN